MADQIIEFDTFLEAVKYAEKHFKKDFKITQDEETNKFIVQKDD